LQNSEEGFFFVWQHPHRLARRFRLNAPLEQLQNVIDVPSAQVLVKPDDHLVEKPRRQCADLGNVFVAAVAYAG